MKMTDFADEHLVAAEYWNTGGRSFGDKTWPPPRFALMAMQQILLAESSDYRLPIVWLLHGVEDAKAPELLVHIAVFDVDPLVRKAALEQLQMRPKEVSSEALKAALRYPWAPVVRHAGHVIAKLEMKEMVPDLVNLLDEPDPAAPHAVVGKDGTEKFMVRELVRINHHRNCMLCHAPIDAATLRGSTSFDIPLGPSPTPDEPLPPVFSPVYYSPKSGNTLVRADITYLRQDFSLKQKVENPGKWPELQRFDFLVRTRELTEMEFAKYPAVKSDYKETIRETLIALTGKEAPPNARAWRKVLAQTEPQWRRPCEK